MTYEEEVDIVKVVVAYITDINNPIDFLFGECGYSFTINKVRVEYRHFFNRRYLKLVKHGCIVSGRAHSKNLKAAIEERKELLSKAVVHAITRK